MVKYTWCSCTVVNLISGFASAKKSYTPVQWKKWTDNTKGNKPVSIKYQWKVKWEESTFVDRIKGLAQNSKKGLLTTMTNIYTCKYNIWAKHAGSNNKAYNR